MTIPSFSELIDPLLRHLASHPEGVRAAEAYEAVADAVGITEEERQELLPSGLQARYKNRIAWAHDRLKRDGLSAAPRRGLWKVTEKGRQLVVTHPDALPNSEVRRLAYPSRASTPDPDPAPQPQPTLGPEERIEEAVQELNDSAASDLLAHIFENSPTFFEAVVLDVLHAMGYGTSRSDLQRLGGSGDGGIDGVIALDALGLEKVYVQAKRWKDKVGRPTIQGFFGALAGRRATKGVFITTSDYTREAEEYAQEVSDSIVLVDGLRLTKLMIEHGCGVTHKTVRIPRIDSDYFEEG